MGIFQFLVLLFHTAENSDVSPKSVESGCSCMNRKSGAPTPVVSTYAGTSESWEPLNIPRLIKSDFRWDLDSIIWKLPGDLNDAKTANQESLELEWDQ